MTQTIINGLEILEEFKKNHRPHYRFKCVCGKEGEARKSRIISGHTKSCGCRRAKVHQPKNTPLPAKTDIIARVMWNMIFDANKRGIDFNLKKSYFKKLITSPCVYCGHTGFSKTEFKGQVLHHNGIDRLDSERGYENGNVKSCCRDCNMGKNKKTKEEFLAWITRTYLHNYGPTLNSVNSVDTFQTGNTELRQSLTTL